MKHFVLSISDECLGSVKTALRIHKTKLEQEPCNYPQWAKDTAADLEDVLLQLDRPQPTSKPNLKDC